MCLYLELPVMRRAPVIQSRNATSLTVRWRAWVNAPRSGMGPVVGYILYYRSHNETDWNQLLQTRLRMLTISGLETSQRYDISVSAVHQTGLIGPRSPRTETTTCGSMCRNTSVHCSVSFTIYQLFLVFSSLDCPMLVLRSNTVIAITLPRIVRLRSDLV